MIASDKSARDKSARDKLASAKLAPDKLASLVSLVWMNTNDMSYLRAL